MVEVGKDTIVRQHGPDVRPGRGACRLHFAGTFHLAPMRRFWLLFSQAVTVLLAAYFVVGTLKPEWLRRPGVMSQSSGVALIEAPTPPTAAPPVGSFRQAAQRASAAVVSINT